MKNYKIIVFIPVGRWLQPSTAEDYKLQKFQMVLLADMHESNTQQIVSLNLSKIMVIAKQLLLNRNLRFVDIKPLLFPRISLLNELTNHSL